MSEKKSLYERLGGYDAIAAVAGDLSSRLQGDALLGRFWANRGEDGVRREKQLLIDYLCASAGGPMYYTGRPMALSHKGMKISEKDWENFLGHLHATFERFGLGAAEREDVLGFVGTLKADIVEC